MVTTDTSIVNIMADSYVEYALATSNRSIMDVVDGLKVSQRRIIQSAFDQRIWNEGPFKKVTRLEGHCLGSYHPQGGAASTIINLCDPSDFLNPLLEGHGNLGGVSLDSRQKISGDGPGAARYLECKFSKFGQSVFDVDIKYLKTKPNYDGSLQEVVNFVPALPLALINGQSGIGTGWSTNTIGFPVNNVINAISKVGGTGIPKALGAPDLPYNTNIIKNNSLVDLHKEGRSSLDLIGEWKIVKKYDSGSRRNRYREAIIITKLATGHAEQFIDKVKDAFEAGKIEGIANIIDETSKEIRVIIVCKSKVKADNVIPSLLKYTTLSAKFSAKFTLVNGGLPGDYLPEDILNIWYKARTDVLLVKFNDEKKGAESRLVIVKGLLQVFPKLREIAMLIMESDTPEDAKTKIIKKYKVSESTADAILNIQLKKLTKLSKKELEQEQESLLSEVERLNSLINNPDILNKEVIRLAKIAAKFASDRVSEVIDKPTIKRKTRTTKKDDIVAKAIKKSVVKCPNGKKSPPIGKRAISIAVNKGMSVNDRVKQHTDYWKRKYSK